MPVEVGAILVTPNFFCFNCMNKKKEWCTEKETKRAFEENTETERAAQRRGDKDTEA